MSKKDRSGYLAALVFVGIVLIFLVAALLSLPRGSHEPLQVAATPEAEVVTETITKYKTVVETEEVEVIVESVPQQCLDAFDNTVEIYGYLSEYDATLGKVDRLLEEASFDLMGSDIHDIVEIETEIRKIHNGSLTTSQDLADARVELERNIELCNREIEE